MTMKSWRQTGDGDPIAQALLDAANEYQPSAALEARVTQALSLGAPAAAAAAAAPVGATLGVTTKLLLIAALALPVGGGGVLAYRALRPTAPRVARTEPTVGAQVDPAAVDDGRQAREPESARAEHGSRFGPADTAHVRAGHAHPRPALDGARVRSKRDAPAPEMTPERASGSEPLAPTTGAGPPRPSAPGGSIIAAPVASRPRSQSPEPAELVLARDPAAGAAAPSSPRGSVAAPPPPSTERIAEEVAVLERAQNSLRAADYAAAIAHLDEHARRFPRGGLGPEAEVMRIAALQGAHRRAEARARARAFLRRQGDGVLAARVRSLLDEAEKTGAKEDRP